MHHDNFSIVEWIMYVKLIRKRQTFWRNFRNHVAPAECVSNYFFQEPELSAQFYKLIYSEV